MRNNIVDWLKEKAKRFAEEKAALQGKPKELSPAEIEHYKKRDEARKALAEWLAAHFDGNVYNISYKIYGMHAQLYYKSLHIISFFFGVDGKRLMAIQQTEYSRETMWENLDMDKLAGYLVQICKIKP